MFFNFSRARRVIVVLIVVSIFMILSIGFTGMAQEIELNLATASLGGAYYPMGQAIGNLVAKYTKGISMVPVVTEGSIANPRLLSNGDADFAITNEDMAYFAVRGEKPYDQKLNISAVMRVHPSFLHIFTLKDSPISSFSDIKGKNVGVGPAGAGTISFMYALLEEYGMSIDDFNPSFLSFPDQNSQLGDRNLDIVFMLAGFPNSAVTGLMATHEIKFIHLEEEHLANLIKKYPYYSEVVVPKEAYKTEKDFPAIGVSNIIIVRNDLDEELVYKVTKAIIENLDEFREENHNAKLIDLEKSAGVPLPFHPGAERYLKEIGILD